MSDSSQTQEIATRTRVAAPARLWGPRPQQTEQAITQPTHVLGEQLLPVHLDLGHERDLGADGNEQLRARLLKGTL
eukprot:1735525-Prymnesium_polylepis.1